MLLKFKDFRTAAAESVRLDWVVIGANLIGVFVVILAGLHARAAGPIIEASAQTGLF